RRRRSAAGAMGRDRAALLEGDGEPGERGGGGRRRPSRSPVKRGPPATFGFLCFCFLYSFLYEIKLLNTVPILIRATFPRPPGGKGKRKEKSLPRRPLFRHAIVGGSIAAVAPIALRSAYAVTPEQTEGPFHPLNRDTDLVQRQDGDPLAEGQVIH